MRWSGTAAAARRAGEERPQSLLNYQGRKVFVDTITRAKLRVEEYAERRLYDRDGKERPQRANNAKGRGRSYPRPGFVFGDIRGHKGYG